MSEEIIDLNAVDVETPPMLPLYRYAAVSEDGTVFTVLLWDGVEEYTPPEGHTLHQLEDDSPVGFGWALRNGNWVDERPEPEEPE